ncbi:MAG TPA: FAD-dependent oxidoreductase [Gammaproteobacteria bacterium]|nr:FAD-dependent oxidoreductase [Gammaproteobacteria bacterium]
MAKTLHPISVRRLVETRSVVTFTFELESGIEYQPGQYVTVQLAGVEDPQGPRRPFSLSSSPTEGRRLSITTRMTDSPFKIRLNELSERGALDELKMRGPMGEFTLDTERAAVMIAGGIGITPFRSMLRCAADRGLGLQVALIYSNSTPAEIVFKRELDDIARRWRHLMIVYTITRPAEAKNWAGKTGRIDADLIREHARALNTPLYYVCGSPAMVEGMSRLIKEELGIAAEDLHAEKFTGY